MVCCETNRPIISVRISRSPPGQLIDFDTVRHRRTVEQAIWAGRCCRFTHVIHRRIVAAVGSNSDRDRNCHAAAAMSACARLPPQSERGSRHHDLGTPSIRPSNAFELTSAANREAHHKQGAWRTVAALAVDHDDI